MRVFVEIRPYGAKNTDADGFGICSPLVFDGSAEQMRRVTDLPQSHWHRLFSNLPNIVFIFNRDQSQIRPRRRQNHKAWAGNLDADGDGSGIGSCFVRTIRNGLSPLERFAKMWIDRDDPNSEEGGREQR